MLGITQVVPGFAALLALALLGSCSGAGGGPRDGGPDSGEPDAARPVAPLPPTAPGLRPCPEGWSEAGLEGGEGLGVCEPWPGGSPPSCGEAEAPLPGESACVAPGSPCPPGRWPEGLPPDRQVVYVDPLAPPGGDGSESAPFSTLGEAVTRAPERAVVALAAGRYEEAVRLARPLSVRGVCPARTSIASGSATASAGVLTIASVGVEVRDLSLSGERPGLWVTGSRTEASLDGLVILGATGVGLVVTGGARVVARELLVQSTRPASGAGPEGRGVVVEYGASLELERSALVGNRHAGLFVAGEGSRAALRGVAVVGTVPRTPSSDFGRGILAQDAGAVEAEALVVHGSAEIGVSAVGAGTRVTLARSVVAATRCRERDGTYGRGLSADDGGLLEARRTLVVGNREHGGLALGAGSRLALEDCVVAATRGRRAEPALGRGAQAEQGGELRLTRVLLLDNRETGVAAFDAETEVGLVDVEVRGTRADETSGFGGRGIDVEAGASLALERVLLEDNVDVGLFLNGGATATATDLAVRETLSTPATATYAGSTGVGVVAQDGATLAATAVLLERNRESGLVVMDPGSRVEVTGLAVLDTLERECVESHCEGFGGGIGIGAYSQGAVEVTRFLVSGSALAGVQVASATDPVTRERLPGDGEMDLHEGEVSGSPVGANVQAEGYDFGRLTDRVVYRDNGRNLDSESLPLPSAALPAGGP